MIHDRVSEGLRCLGLEPLEGLTGNLKVRPEMLVLRQLDFKYANCGLSCSHHPSPAQPQSTVHRAGRAWPPYRVARGCRAQASDWPFWAAADRLSGRASWGRRT